MAATNNRPLSPHLQVWRWGPAMLVSILHRVTGDGLALVGLGVLPEMNDAAISIDLSTTTMLPCFSAM